MRADAKTEAAVMDVINKYNEAYTKRDLDGVLTLFPLDDDVIVIGTGGDERRVGLTKIKAQIERDFAQSESASIEITWHSVSVAGSVAWVAANCVARVMVSGQEISLPLRSTAVLEQRGDRWLIVQSHASIPATSQMEGESFPVQQV